MKRAALYCRVSTDEQVRHGYSIGAQLTALREHAKRNNYIIVGEFIDEGISARKSYKKRPALLRLLEEVKNDHVDIVLFIKLDRWFRNVEAYYQVQPILDQHNVAWKTVLEDYETVTASGRLKVNIMLSVAQDEADRTSERIKFVFADKRNKGEWVSGNIPYGYRKENKRMVIDEETAPIARAIFNHYIDSRSVYNTVRWVYAQYGLKRSYDGIKDMLKNPKYLGGNNYPPLIDRETFSHVQELMTMRSTRNSSNDKVPYQFSGLVYCKECGRKMKANRPNNWEYYSCATRWDSGRCENHISVRQDKLETYLLNNIERELQGHNIKILEKQQPPKDTEKIKRKMEKLKDLYLNDLISREIYERDYRTLEKDLSSSFLAPKTVDIDTISDAMSKYHSLSKASQKAFWSRILKRIEIDREGNIFLMFE